MISDRTAYLLIAEDYGGAIHTSGHPSLNYMVATQLGSDDEEAARMALAALENAGIIKLAGRSVEVIQTVDPATLSDDAYDWIEEELTEEPAEDAPPSTESVAEVADQDAVDVTPEAEAETEAGIDPDTAHDAPAAAQPPVSATPSVLSRLSPRPAEIKIALPSPSSSPAAITRRPAEGPAPRWQSASGNRSAPPSHEARQLAAARRKIERLEIEQRRLERRLAEEQEKRGEAEARARTASSTRSRLHDLQNLVVALRVQLIYAIAQTNAELATLRQQLADANGTNRHLERDLAQAAAAEPARHRELEAEVARLTQEVGQLTRARQELEKEAITLRGNLAGEEEAHELCLDENERLIERLQQCGPVMGRYLEASRRPVRLTCGHKIIIMVDSPDHIPGIRQGCNRVRIVEGIGDPPPLLDAHLSDPPAPRPAQPRRPKPPQRRHRRK